jgi:hypothetical protein
VCAVAHRRDNDSGKKTPSSSQRRERRLDRAVIMMMPIIAKFALVLVPPSPRLLIRVKNAFTVYLMVKRYFSLSYFIMHDDGHETTGKDKKFFVLC